MPEPVRFVMAESQSTAGFGGESRDLTETDERIVDEIAEQIDTDDETLELYEGATTGSLYVEGVDAYHCGTVTDAGLTVTTVQDPGEELEPLARVAPDTDADVSDSPDSVTYFHD